MQLTSRTRSLFCPIGPTELLILGGNHRGNRLNDSIVIDTVVDPDLGSVRRLPPCSTDSRFQGINNQCHFTKRGEVIALVQDEEYSVKLVTYRRGQR